MTSNNPYLINIPKCRGQKKNFKADLAALEAGGVETRCVVITNKMLWCLDRKKRAEEVEDEDDLSFSSFKSSLALSVYSNKNLEVKEAEDESCLTDMVGN